MLRNHSEVVNKEILVTDNSIKVFRRKKLESVHFILHTDILLSLRKNKVVFENRGVKIPWKHGRM